MSSTKTYAQNWSSELLGKLREEKLLTDIELLVENERFSAHRAILSAASHYFFKMFTGNMVESSLSSIPLSGVSSNIFKVLQCSQGI